MFSLGFRPNVIRAEISLRAEIFIFLFRPRRNFHFFDNRHPIGMSFVCCIDIHVLYIQL